MKRLPLVVAVLWLLAAPAAAQERTRIGILPFDIAIAGGGTATAATSMAKLVRAHMVSSKTLEPILLDLPPGLGLPLQNAEVAAIAADRQVAWVLAGTIIDATTTRGTNKISTGPVGGIPGLGNVGGTVAKVRASVQLHLELSGADGRLIRAFEVAGTNTDIGIGADIWTTLGGFDLGATDWDQSAMGKALREAAQKVTAEVTKGKGK
jgi:hypothetical protein